MSFSNRDTVKAEVVGTDPSSDLAVLRVNTSASALTPLPLGNSDAVAGRRSGRRDRQPVRPRPHRHVRDRERSPAPDHGAEPLHDRPRHPDRRADQPRQLRRAAPQRRGQVIGVNTQIETGGHGFRQRRHRVLRSLQHRQGRRRADPPHGARRPCLPRHQRHRHHPRRRRDLQPRREGGRPRRDGDERQRRRQGRARGRPDSRSSSPARRSSSVGTSS